MQCRKCDIVVHFTCMRESQSKHPCKIRPPSPHRPLSPPSTSSKLSSLFDNSLFSNVSHLDPHPQSSSSETNSSPSPEPSPSPLPLCNHSLSVSKFHLMHWCAVCSAVIVMGTVGMRCSKCAVKVHSQCAPLLKHSGATDGAHSSLPITDSSVTQSLRLTEPIPLSQSDKTDDLNDIDFVVIEVPTPPVDTPMSAILTGISSRDRWGRWVSRMLQEKGLSKEELQVVTALETQLKEIVEQQASFHFLFQIFFALFSCCVNVCILRRFLAKRDLNLAILLCFTIFNSYLNRTPIHLAKCVSVFLSYFAIYIGIGLQL
jgi:hypothetical protein